MQRLETNAHFSLSYLYENREGVLRRLRKAGLAGFTLTHKGEPIGFVRLAAVKPRAASPLPPQEYDDQPPLGASENEYDDSPSDEELAALMQQNQPGDLSPH